ncbi:MAG: 3-dehydroquinate synthase [Cenarchaeum sp. SB0662_bin_33]|nr:3-dehydroquinate synthase [Cenarchaeum sp. SB0664_bin_35]MYB46810.1 3-dehydroquinate synthase [Cenarchaeum sp. SB0662_bin_33]
MFRDQNIIVAPTEADPTFLQNIHELGIGVVFTDTDSTFDLPLDIIRPSGDSTYVWQGSDQERVGRRYHILSNTDIQLMLHDASGGLDFVIADVDDWKIIPLENTIAKLHDVDTKILVVARTADEVRKMFSILDIGVDGVILETDSIQEVSDAVSLQNQSSFEMTAARVTAVREVGDGERVCVDTASILHMGEGLLVGNRSNFLFLIHNESVGSSFTSPRPFRVNAGAVHCYTPSPDGTTKYLSEIESGSEVVIVTKSGASRRAIAGRSKIERRPMLLIAAATTSESGGIIAQNAETIRFVRPDGELVSVTHLKEGDKIMVHATPAAGRHFGMRVESEYILEK